jgi:outer membrane immunogenic protein
MRIVTSGMAAVAAALIATAMNAADLPVKAPPRPVVTGFNWTGCYGGGHVGGLWAHKDWALAPPDAITPLGGHNADSWTAGLQAGCDYQFANRWVIGIQGAYGWSDAKGSHIDVVDGTIDQTTIRSIASVTARLGYAWDRWLGYVRGGGAWADDRYVRTLIPAGPVDGLAKETRGGWTAGVGIEYTITDYLSAFIEYDHYWFGSRTLTFVTPPAGVFEDNVTIRQDADTVKAGVNFRWAAFRWR